MAKESKELSRREFLKTAGLWLGGLALGGLLAACSKNEREVCADPEHLVTLNRGDYVIVGGYRFKVVGYQDGQGEDWAYFNLRDRWGEFVELDLNSINNEYRGVGLELHPHSTVPMNPAMKVDGFLWFEPDKNGIWGFNRVVHRCNHDTFSFWTSEEIKEIIRSYPTQTPRTPNPRPTRTPAATFP